ncbi:DUF1934 domain-containing protein [Caldibacillus lycopersici]|uniref:DUF1934 domain-containing protein n=1 Tax=Perspicuibacillus lycopersici TaxID=1325689 RepID=A0AAE3ISE0_9BACI|nr:DUF1934 domain-containing protein [Perspicuibacillus lycopersici]MCU9613337.1 DUF1934 domain-containing protein [Perspicuibacillus lycopersici]
MTTAGTPVKIELQTKITQNGELDTFELIVFGQYYQKGNTSYLIYDEVLETGNVHTVIKFSEQGGSQIIRKGALNMRLAFHLDEDKGGSYKTDIGTLLLTTNTQRLKFRWDSEQKQGTLDIKYYLFMEQMEVGTYQLSFKFKEDTIG